MAAAAALDPIGAEIATGDPMVAAAALHVRISRTSRASSPLPTAAEVPAEMRIVRAFRLAADGDTTGAIRILDTAASGGSPRAAAALRLLCDLQTPK